MHRVLTENPVYKEAVEQVARIKGAQRRHQEQTAKAETAYRAAAAAYHQEAVEALREGREAPERPTPPEVDAALVQQLTQDCIECPALIREAERKLAAALLPQMEARAFEVEETVREFADQMRGLAREASELRVTVAAQRSAAGLTPLVNQGVVDVAALLDCVLRGDRLLTAESPISATRDAGAFDLSAPRGSAQVISFASLGGRR